jgi:hypothetical protein
MRKPSSLPGLIFVLIFEAGLALAYSSFGIAIVSPAQNYPIEPSRFCWVNESPSWPIADAPATDSRGSYHCDLTTACPLLTQRWGNRPAFLWMAKDLRCCASG